MIIAILICLIVIIMLFINALKKIDLELPTTKAELIKKENKTKEDILEIYKIKEKSRRLNIDDKLELEVEFSNKLFKGDKSNREYFEAIINDFVKLYKTDFVLVDNEKDIKIEVFATSENNYKYKINDIEDYYKVVEEKNEQIKNFKEIEVKNAEIKNEEIEKFDHNDWSVLGAGVKILEYGDGYLGYDNYKVLTNDIYIDTIILEKTFEEEVIKGIKVGTPKEEIKEKLGEPTFGENGYKIKDSYMFFYDEEIAIYPNTKFKNSQIEEMLFNYIKSEEKEDLEIFSHIIIVDNLDFKSWVDENNVFHLESPNRGICIHIDENKQVTADIYNNYDITERTKEFIRNGIFKLNSEIDTIYEIEKNRK